MRHFITLLVAMATLLPVGLHGKTWHSADSLPLLGKGIDPASTAMRYQRLPDSLKNIVKRDYVYHLGTNSAGMAVRFASNAPEIDIKWTNLHMTTMNNMTPTGIRGLDLYALMPDSTWTFVNTARPDLYNRTTTTNVIVNMDPVMREYMLYLPLYDGIDSLYIGIGEEYTLKSPSVDLPKVEKPIVMYGTSILQGGCANRPGMAHTNILRRRLNHETINFGFSGNGQLDLEVADVLAAVPDPGMYILDFVPNVNEEQIDTLLIPFVEIIERAHPGIPIMLVEDPVFSLTCFDRKLAENVPNLNRMLRKKYDMLSARYPNLYFLPSTDIVGHDNEAFVDGIHFTDLGFTRYADILEPILSQILEKSTK